MNCICMCVYICLFGDFGCGLLGLDVFGWLGVGWCLNRGGKPSKGSLIGQNRLPRSFYRGKLR